MTTQIAVKLPEEIVREIDALVAQGVFPSRSAAVRRGLLAVLAAQRRAAVDRAYEEAYRRIPESEAELEEAARLAREAVREEPWEPWW